MRGDIAALDLTALPAPAKGKRIFLLPNARPEQLALAEAWQAEVLRVPEAQDLDDPLIETAFLTGVVARAVGEVLAREAA